MPSSRERVEHELADARSSRARRRLLLDQVTRAPNRRSSCASSIPTGPPPSTHTLSGISVIVVASRFVQ